jgi:hypothetical protein
MELKNLQKVERKNRQKNWINRIEEQEKAE